MQSRRGRYSAGVRGPFWNELTVIEYALLFALGFLAATLAGLMVAPAVHKRIVRFTESRLLATMPLSPQEVRAQKDMARAAFAAENARLAQSVAREREKHTLERVRNEKLLAQAAAIGTENAELHAQIADMNIEAADMRSALRRAELTIVQLKTALNAADRENRNSLLEIERLTGQANHLVADIDNMRIDLATHDTTEENLKSRLAGLRDERDRLREELKAAAEQAKALEIRLSNEEERVRRLEGRLSRAVAGNADRDSVIERRTAEIARLRDKVKALTGDGKTPAKTARTSRNAVKAPPLVEVNALEEDVRNQATALSERLLSAADGSNDAALREEMADIATKMIVLTATREGPSSPVRTLIGSIDPALEGDGKSLAGRARERLGDEA